MDRKNVVISGYPKSGNTWLCRLTAELLQCPFEGYWKTKDKELNKEETQRLSVYACYKSHHQWHELLKKDEQPWKIIYIVRDPRDILFSGISFFGRYYGKKTTPRWLHGILRHRLYVLLGGKRLLRKAMLKALITGNKKINYWCRVPWAEHVTPYLDHPEVFITKYETLLAEPEAVCRDLIQFLGLQRTPEEIRNAIHLQSFDVVKKKFHKAEDQANAAFLRKGQKGEWKSKLNTEEQRLLDTLCGEIMRRLGYL